MLISYRKKLIPFLLLVTVAIWVNYFAPDLITTAFFVFTLIAYYRSKEEAFWLAFFLVTTDGVLGFFGNYEALLSVIPGLPGIEVGQFYILLSVVKAWNKKEVPRPFYSGILKILGLYLLFLVAQGYAIGISGAMNVQFRMVKILLPFLLLFSLPRLFEKEEDYRQFFAYMFPLAFCALAAQMFTLSMGYTPSQFVGADQEVWFAKETTKDYTYRGAFSTATLLITLFGALYFLARKEKAFSPIMLNAVLFADFVSVFLSATRGWVLGFGISIVLFFLFIMPFNSRYLTALLLSGVLIIGAAFYFPVVEIQLNNAYERIMTLELLASGDLSAGGTLSRIESRSPRVMKKWRESPLTGWGFSDMYFKYSDVHVGNQTILLHAGLVGALLIVIFLTIFFGKIFLTSIQLARDHPLKKASLVFPVFFMGWFLIHSSSGQHFGFYINPSDAMIQSLFFSFGALVYREMNAAEAVLSNETELVL